MGFLSSLFGSSSESSQESSTQSKSQQEQESKQTGTQATTSSTSSTGTTTGQQTQTGIDVTSTLGVEEQQILSSLIERLGLNQAGGAGADALAAITGVSAEVDPAVLKSLSDRALSFGDQRDRIQADLRAAATQRFQETGARTVAQQQQAIGAGTKFNSASQLIDIEAQRKLGVDLAGLSAATDLQLNQQEESALLAALSGSGIAGATAGASSNAPLQELLQALTISRGTNVVTERSSEQKTAQQTAQESQTQELIETLRELVSKGTASSSSSSKGTKQGTAQESIFGQLVSGFAAVTG